MARPSQKVLNWLHNVLANDYRFVDRTYADVVQALTYNPWLSLRTEVYTFEQGTGALLLNLHGSLPVTFRGAKYGFPISIWVPQEYPARAPMSFVVPARGLVLRPGQYVSGEGRIYHPFVAGWNPDTSNLSHLISILQDIFGKEPPVVAAPRQNYTNVPPTPPLPPKETTSLGQEPPRLPPKPFTSPKSNGATKGPPPLPPLPQDRSPPIPVALRSPPLRDHIPPTLRSPPPQQYQTQRITQPIRSPDRGSTFSNRDPARYQIPQVQSMQARPQTQATARPPEDLLTSPFEAPIPVEVETAPPPIPPNPQKDALLSAISQTLGEQIRTMHASSYSAITPLRAQQSALANTAKNIGLEMSQLTELEKMLSSNEGIIHQAMRDADTVLDDAKRRNVPNVDEVLIAPTVVSRQLYEAVADQGAIEDCRNVLAKALDRGRIGGQVWAKQTRSLAREEFLKKALVKKISRGMGLVEEGVYQ